MSRRRGVQAEILTSLAVVMVTATGLLTAFFLKAHTAQVERLQGLLGRALSAEARTSNAILGTGTPGIEWWAVSGDGSSLGISPGVGGIDADSRSLADAARHKGVPVMRTGLPWEPMRFAIPGQGEDEAMVARLPAAVSRTVVSTLLVADVLVFTIFGAYLLRRQVVRPLSRLGAAARAIAEGEFSARLPVEGVAEASDVAWAFNEMSEALERRTGALEKAVGELRTANESLRRAREGLDRAERLAAVGRLASGVAHEVGNPMGALLAFLDLAGRDEGLSKEARGHLDRAAGEGQRVRTILRQLLDFSRPPRATREPVELPGVVEQTVGLVRAQRRYSGVDFAVHCEAELGPVISDEGMVAQILLNLMLNAADAVRMGSEPRVEIHLRRVPLRLRAGEDDDSANGRIDADGIECEVADNGPGVPPEDRDRIFDPFYTTKPPGEGTGLGLANAMSLTVELGGALECREKSALGGASFALRLPVWNASDLDRSRVREG